MITSDPYGAKHAAQHESITSCDELIADDVHAEHAACALRSALAAAESLGALVPGVPRWMMGAFAAMARMMAEDNAGVVTPPQVVEGLLQLAAKGFRDRPPVPGGFPRWPAITDPHERYRMELVLRVLRSRLATTDSTVPLFTIPDLLDTANEAALADDDVDTAALRALRRIASSGAFRHLAPLPDPAALREMREEMPNFAQPIDFYMGQAALAARKGETGATFPPILRNRSPSGVLVRRRGARSRNAAVGGRSAASTAAA